VTALASFSDGSVRGGLAGFYTKKESSPFTLTGGRREAKVPMLSVWTDSGLERKNKRPNVEATIGLIKAKIRERVRSKTDIEKFCATCSATQHLLLTTRDVRTRHCTHEFET